MRNKGSVGLAIGGVIAVMSVSIQKTVGLSRMVGSGNTGGDHHLSCGWWYLMLTILLTIIFFVCILTCDVEEKNCPFTCIKNYFYGFAGVTTLFFLCTIYG